MNTWEGPWPTLGHTVVDWIEAYAKHGPGPVAGQDVTLTDEEVRFILRRYQVHPSADCGRPGCHCSYEIGKWRYTWSVYSRLKGARKSELSSWITGAELCGPVRFGGWDANGDPVAVTIHELGGTPDIIVLATAEEQAEDTTWSSLYYWLSRSEPGQNLEILKDQINHSLGGNARLRTSSSIARDGGRITFSACEETHLWYSRELIDLDKVNRRNLDKLDALDPWGLSVTTMFKPGQGSVAEKDWKAAFGSEPDPGILYDHREAAKRPDESDPTLTQAERDKIILDCCIDAIGDAAWLNPRRLMRSYKRDPIEGERYWFNRRTTSTDVVVDEDAWDALVVGGPFHPDDAPLKSNDMIALGFDGGQSDDHTGIVGTRLTDGMQFVAGHWESADYSYDELHMLVEERLDWLFAEYDVKRLYADPPYWQDDLARWSGRWGEKRVASWWTQREAQMTWATHRWHQAITSTQLCHDGNATLAEHVRNSRRRETAITVEIEVDEDGKSHKRKGFVLRKEHRGSSDKIDLAVCSVISWEARADCIAAGEHLKPKKKSGRLIAF